MIYLINFNFFWFGMDYGIIVIECIVCVEFEDLWNEFLGVFLFGVDFFGIVLLQNVLVVFIFMS